MPNTVIKVDHLHKMYPSEFGDISALSNMTFSIRQGEFVAIMGPSGSGKSTLMHILGALDVPTSGHYWLNGQEISHYSRRELAAVRNQKIGFVFQNYNLLPRLSALENVMLPMEYAGMSEETQHEIAVKFLNQVGLGNRLDFPPNKLSGGQQQRVAIARALVMNPAMILADEPTGNIASVQAKEIIQIFQQLNRQGGHTIVIITHEPEVAQSARRIISILDGKIIDDTARRKQQL